MDAAIGLQNCWMQMQGTKPSLLISSQERKGIQLQAGILFAMKNYSMLLIPSLKLFEAETVLCYGANVEQVVEGSTPFQTIFRRSCKADSGDEPSFSTADNQTRQYILKMSVVINVM